MPSRGGFRDYIDVKHRWFSKAGGYEMKLPRWLFILLFFAIAPAMAEGPPIVEPGYHNTPFVTDEDVPMQVGFVEIWNTPQTLEIRVHTTDG